METAPLFSEMADGPDAGQAWWLRSSDDVRIRVGLWNAGGANGTVLLFPGRTEYVEKYGRTATDLAKGGFATFVIDWRGQGLADRLVSDAMAGHVVNFSDYQRDVAAMVAAATELDLPKPWYLLGHSMGGCIGLRSLFEGLPVNACAFSAPMWGIQMSDALRPVAWSLSWGSQRLGMGHVYAPGTYPKSYVLNEPFETNKLTNDRDMYQYMVDHAKAQPSLGLGGPSLRWLHEALKETRDLSWLPSPDLPCVTLLGTDEQIVDIPRVENRMSCWRDGKLEMVQDGKHELLMDNPQIRGTAAAEFCKVFSAAAEGPVNRVPRSASGGQAPQSQATSRRHRSGNGADFFPFLPQGAYRLRSHHRGAGSSSYSDKI